MKKTALRITAIVTLLLCLSSLSGCIPSIFKKIDVNTDKPFFDIGKLPFFKDCDTTPTDFDLEHAINKIELSGIAAAYEDGISASPYNLSAQFTAVFLGDINDDGIDDLYAGTNAYISGDKKTILHYEDMDSYSLCSDNDGNLYLNICGGEGLTKGDQFHDIYSHFYYHFNGKEITKSVFSQSVSYVYNSSDLPSIDYIPYVDTIRIDTNYSIAGETVDEAAYTKHTEDLGLAQVETTGKDFVSNSFDIAHKNELLEGIKNHFNGIDGFEGFFTQDIDNDGENESVFIFSDILGGWNIDKSKESFSYGNADDFSDRTVFLVCDDVENKFNVTAISMHCSYNDLGYIEMSCSNGLFCNGENFALLPAGTVSAQAEKNCGLEELADLLRMYGWSNIIIKQADISDLEGNEYICILENESAKRNLFVYSITDGVITILYQAYLDDMAIYTSTIDNKLYLVTYSQKISNYSSSAFANYYEYVIFRPTGITEHDIYDTEIAYYNDTITDATPVSEFFKKFNLYARKISPCYDPYRVTGKTWLIESEGTYVENPATIEETYPVDSGYVNIKDATSWLNLRTGPGTNYPVILTDPYDPDSYVRQAKGAPVTVLETIETNDTKNPIWVKIRIVYGSEVLEGYSSKTYIKLYNEQ